MNWSYSISGGMQRRCGGTKEAFGLGQDSHPTAATSPSRDPPQTPTCGSWKISEADARLDGYFLEPQLGFQLNQPGCIVAADPVAQQAACSLICIQDQSQRHQRNA